MKTARKNLRRVQNKSGKKSRLLLFSLSLTLLLLAILFFLIKTSIWNGKEKFTLAVNGGETVLISIFDPRRGSITKILIPNSVQIVAAGGLGTWKLGSVWQLGQNEKRGGDLLAKTVTKNFAFPVYAWGDAGASGFSDGRISKVLSAIIGKYKTNLKIGDRIKLGIFSLKVGQTKRITINLADISESLREQTFLDGSKGYILRGGIPDRITALFTDEAYSNKNYKAQIVLKTVNQKSAESVSRVVEVMGVKVASVIKEDPEDINCIVTGKNRSLVKSIALVLGCDKKEEKEAQDSFDIEVILGEGFSRIY